MFKYLVATLALALPVLACDGQAPTPSDLPEPSAAVTAPHAGGGVVRRRIPSDDPGPPLYARATTILDQLFHVDGWLTVPFYRDPACIPDDFNLLQHYDVPGPAGPGAFACPLRVNGFLLTERDAPLGAFPRHVVLRGDAVPVWFVRWSDFETEAADGVVTFAELDAMTRLSGTATRFRETLNPRAGEHRVSIQAMGMLDDGRAFHFRVLHLEDQTRSIRLRLR